MQRGAGQGRAAGAIVVRAHNAVMLRHRHSVLVPERVPRTTVGRSLALRTPNGGAAGTIGGGRWARSLSAVAFRGLSSLCVGIFGAWIRCVRAWEIDGFVVGWVNLHLKPIE